MESSCTIFHRSEENKRVKVCLYVCCTCALEAVLKLFKPVLTENIRPAWLRGSPV